MGGRGRGRGRGRGNVTFNMEAIGFGKGDSLPAPTLKPAPAYPPLRRPPLPLSSGDDVEYMLALQKEYLQTMQSSPFFVQAEEAKEDVERYSDKYRAVRTTDSTIAWKPDWRRLPRELKIAVRKRRKVGMAVAPNLSNAKVKAKQDDVDIKKKLDDLEKRDHDPEEEKSDKEGSDSDADIEEVLEDEEENEEENDYLTSYFDNGESYLDEEEDNLDDKDGGIY